MRGLAALWLLLVAGQGSAQEARRIDHLAFANGAIPVRVGDAGAEAALRTIDGDLRGFTIASRADSTTTTWLVYELPALTRFDRARHGRRDARALDTAPSHRRHRDAGVRPCSSSSARSRPWRKRSRSNPSA